MIDFRKPREDNFPYQETKMKEFVIKTIIFFLVLLEVFTFVIALAVVEGNTTQLEKFSISCALIGCTASLIGCIFSLKVLQKSNLYRLSL